MNFLVRIIPALIFIVTGLVFFPYLWLYTFSFKILAIGLGLVAVGWTILLYKKKEDKQ